MAEGNQPRSKISFFFHVHEIPYHKIDPTVAVPRKEFNLINPPKETEMTQAFDGYPNYLDRAHVERDMDSLYSVEKLKTCDEITKKTLKCLEANPDTPLICHGLYLELRQCRGAILCPKQWQKVLECSGGRTPNTRQHFPFRCGGYVEAYGDCDNVIDDFLDKKGFDRPF